MPPSSAAVPLLGLLSTQRNHPDPLLDTIALPLPPKMTMNSNKNNNNKVIIKEKKNNKNKHQWMNVVKLQQSIDACCFFYYSSIRSSVGISVPSWYPHNKYEN